MQPAKIIESARECLGTPFVHQGRVIGIGLDCIGVAIHVARALGHHPDDVMGYAMLPAHGVLEAALDACPFLERLALPYPGTILLMRFGDEPQHVAICAGDSIIHSYSRVGAVVEHHYSDLWRARTVRVYGFVGAAGHE